MTKRDLNAAKLLFNSYIRLGKELKKAYYYRGQCYMKLQRYDSAYLDFDTVISFYKKGNYLIVPNENILIKKPKGNEITLLKALFYRGQAGYYLDSLKQSLNDFQICMENNIDYLATGLLWQGYIEVKQNNWQKACYTFKTALEKSDNQQERQQAKNMLEKYCK